MANAISGSLGAVKVGAVVVAELKEWTLNIDTDLYDVTVFNDTFHESIGGLRAGQGTAVGFWMLSDPGQLALQQAVLGGTQVAMTLTADGTKNYTCNAWVKQIAVKTPIAGSVEVTFAFTTTGAVTYV